MERLARSAVALLVLVFVVSVAPSPALSNLSFGLCGTDVSTALNNGRGSFFGMGNSPNMGAFAALHTDGSIATWGRPESGGVGGPTDAGYVSVYTSSEAFAALKADGSITAWGDPDAGGTGAPTDSGYNRVFSTLDTFAALKADGSITVWGYPDSGGTGAPTDNGYTDIFSTETAFAALKPDGSITAWGNPAAGGTGAPTDDGYVDIYNTYSAFAALNGDGTITTWGNPNSGGSGGPTDGGYVDVVAGAGAFAAIKADGTIATWAGSLETTTSGYTNLHPGFTHIWANAADGSLTTWGPHEDYAPTGTGYVKGYSSSFLHTASLRNDGSITTWGLFLEDLVPTPTDSGYVDVFTNWGSGFAAMKADGSITAWGNPSSGGSGAPADNGYVHIMSVASAFAAIKADGSITSWGDPNYGGSGAPTDAGYVSINGISPNPTTCALANSMSAINLNSTTVAEQTPSGSAVAQLTTDDTSTSGPYTYSLVPGVGDEDNAKFAIDGDQLVLNFTPDFEAPVDQGAQVADNTYSVRIMVTDSAGETYHDYVIITVTDLDEFNITGTVAFDVNRDQVVDGGEPDISGAELELRAAGPDGLLGTADDVAVDTATTASPYSFTDVLPGDYQIVLDPASLSAGVYPTGATTANVTVTTSSVVESFAANYLKVSGTLADSAGQPIPNTVVTLTDSQGNVFTATTDADGNYTFEGSETSPLYAGLVTLTTTVNGETVRQSGTVEDATPIRLDLTTTTPVSNPASTVFTNTSTTNKPAANTTASGGNINPPSAQPSKTLAATGVTTTYALVLSAALLAAGLTVLVIGQSLRRRST